MNILISIALFVLLGLYLVYLFRDKRLVVGLGGGIAHIFGMIMTTIVLITFTIQGKIFNTEFDLLNYILIFSLMLASLIDLVLAEK